MYTLMMFYLQEKALLVKIEKKHQHGSSIYLIIKALKTSQPLDPRFWGQMVTTQNGQILIFYIISNALSKGYLVY